MVPIINGISDESDSEDSISNVTINIKASNGGKNYSSINGLTTNGGISIDETLVVNIDANNALANGISFTGSGATLTKAYITVCSSYANTRTGVTSACVKTSQAITVYGGYYSNKNSNGVNTKATAFSGNSSGTNINAIGGIYTKSVESKYVHDTSANDPQKNKYQCIALNPTVEYDGTVYTHTIVPKEVCVLTTAANTTGTKFHTLQSAIDAIKPDDTSCRITLLKDIDTLSGLNSAFSTAQFNYTSAKGYSLKMPVTLDMAGHSITIPKIDYPIFVENCHLTLVNSSSANSTISNGDGDAIHVGAEYTSPDYAKLIIDNTANNLYVTASSKTNHSIKTGWSYKDEKSVTHTCMGTVIINGGCYYGDITKGDNVEAVIYSISGGYYTDGELYTGYASQSKKHGSKDSYLAKYYACIDNPDSNKNIYAYKVVPDDNIAKLKYTTVTINDTLAVNLYFQNYANPTKDLSLTNGDHKVRVTIKKRKSSAAPYVDTITIPAETTELNKGNYHKITFSVITPKQLDDVISLELLDPDNNTVGIIVDRTVESVVRAIFKDTKNIYSENEEKMVNALVNYGSFAQIEFAYNADKLVNTRYAGYNTTLDFEKWGTSSAPSSNWTRTYAKVVDDGFAGISEIGRSLIMDTSTSLRFYYQLDAGQSIDNFTFMYNKGSSYDEGSALSLTPHEDSANGWWYVDVPKIVSTKLMTPYTVRVTSNDKNMDVTSSVSDYFYDYYNKDVKGRDNSNHPDFGRATCVLNNYSIEYSNEVDAKKNQQN